MKTTLWTIALLTVASLIAGCGKPQAERPAPAAPSPQVDVNMPASPRQSASPSPAEPRSTANRAPEGAGVADKNHRNAPVETKETEESTADRPASSSEKPTVLKAVSRALFKALTPDSDRTRPADAPAFRPNR